MDRISDLPDDLLQGILLGLCSTLAAARTSCLSRRWRRVWESLPELVLSYDVIDHRASFLDTVDDALATCTASPAVLLRHLEIIVPHTCQNVPAGRVAAWLLSSSRRLAGQLILRVPFPALNIRPQNDEIELPPFQRATGIALVLGRRFLLRPPPAGMFAALAQLDISCATMDGRALEVLVSSQCPRLEKLTLLYVTLVKDSDVSISSASLRHLTFYVRNTRCLNVAAPNLQKLRASLVADVRVAAAPNLDKLEVSSGIQKFFFADRVRHLRRLDIKHWSVMALLIPWLDTVDELRLPGPAKTDEFERFMDGTNKLPKCATLLVDLTYSSHVALPSVLHLLRRSENIRKLIILLGHDDKASAKSAYRCSLACPCRLPQNAMAHDINLDSLEEIEFRLSQEGDEYIVVLERLLSISNVRKLQNVDIDLMYLYPSELYL